MNGTTIFALVDTTTYKLFSGEAWAQAGKTTLLGMGAVFAVLIIIMLVVQLMGKVFGKEKKAEAKPTEAAPAVTEAAPAEATEDDEQLAAVITAAISAYLAQEEGYTGGFRVVSFRKANTKSAWTKS